MTATLETTFIVLGVSYVVAASLAFAVVALLAYLTHLDAGFCLALGAIVFFVTVFMTIAAYGPYVAGIDTPSNESAVTPTPTPFLDSHGWACTYLNASEPSGGFVCLPAGGGT